MSLLAPLFLLGALAVLGPIVFHLVRRSARERTPFSSLMFLLPAPPRLAQRRKLEQVSLLVLRCLCLLLLAAAFARPLLSKDSLIPLRSTTGSQRVLLLDTSASMRRENLWNEARQIAEHYLDKSSPEDQTALLVFDRQPRTLVTFADWASWPADERAAMARQRLTAVSPRFLGTHLGLALASAAEQFATDSPTGQAPGRRELVLITDLQEGSDLAGLQGFDWPHGVQVILERVNPKRRTNAGVQVLDDSNGARSPDAGVQLRLVSARDSEKEKFRLHWVAETGTATGATLDIYLPPGQTRTLSAPPLPPAMTAGSMRLEGDDADFDNTAYFSAPKPQHVAIAYFGNEAPKDSTKLRFYLDRVFQSTPRREVTLSPVLTNDLPLPAFALSRQSGLGRAAFAVVPGALESRDIRMVRDWLMGGKTALLVLTGTEMSSTLAGLADWPEVQVSEAAGDYALLGSIDFKHPIFAPFADPRFSDFTHIHFWKHRRWDMPPGGQARVLAKFDDGAPALVQLPVGQGNLLVLASGWNPADSQLALSSKFAPLLQTMLDWSGTGTPQRCQFLTGDALPSPAPTGGTVQWRKPDGNKITLAAGAPFTETDVPGIYTAAIGDQERRFAVNLPLQESRTAPLSPDELARLGVPLQTTPEMSAVQAGERERHLRQEELENRQKLWRWLIAGVLVVALTEIILSGWLARRSKSAELQYESPAARVEA